MHPWNNTAQCHFLHFKRWKTPKSAIRKSPISSDAPKYGFIFALLMHFDGVAQITLEEEGA